jgi:drug/metabolite transporter (DMT)-like permease
MTNFVRLLDWSLLIVCNLIWASQFVLVKIVQEQLGPVAATSLPIAAATLLLVPIVLRQRRGRLLPRQDVWRFVLIGLCGQVPAQLLITWGVRFSLASNAALLMLALPVSTAVMAYFILGERMSAVRWLSFVLAIAGVVECSGIDWAQLDLTGRGFFWGNVMIFCSVNGSAFYNVYSKKLLVRHSPLDVLLYSYYVVTAVLLPVTLISEPSTFHNLPQLSVRTWIGLLLLAGAVYLLSMVLFLHVLQRLDATQAGLSNYLIPFFGVLVAAIVLGERLTAPMIAGGGLVLASTLLITLYEQRQDARARAASVVTK